MCDRSFLFVYYWYGRMFIEDELVYDTKHSRSHRRHSIATLSIYTERTYFVCLNDRDQRIFLWSSSSIKLWAELSSLQREHLLHVTCELSTTSVSYAIVVSISLRKLTECITVMEVPKFISVDYTTISLSQISLRIKYLLLFIIKIVIEGISWTY